MGNIFSCLSKHQFHIITDIQTDLTGMGLKIELEVGWLLPSSQTVFSSLFCVLHFAAQKFHGFVAMPDS